LVQEEIGPCNKEYIHKTQDKIVGKVNDFVSLKNFNRKYIDYDKRKRN